MLKKILRSILLILSVILVIIFFNTFRFTSKQPQVPAIEKKAVGHASVQHLSEAIQFETNSFQDSSLFDSLSFIKFRHFLERTYPEIHSRLTREIINKYSLLYKWEGKRTDLKPIILMAHQDVVPVEETAIGKWKVAPYSGKVQHGEIWGRGARDDKLGVIGIMEAVEMLLKEGHAPDRTVYLCFGHDEEVNGAKGAKLIAEKLLSRQVKAEFILDEGYLITRDLIPGIQKDVALIGTAEKGYMSAELSIDMQGGHSSMPANETAIDVLAAAVVKLKNKPLDPQFAGPVEGFFEAIGPEMPFLQKIFIANRWLFKPVLFKLYAAKPSSNALIRTTAAFTIFNSGIKDNVLPTKATAIINFRLLPSEKATDVLTYLEKTIEDERVLIRLLPAHSNASPVSSTNSFGYKVIEKTIIQNYPDVLVAPNLVIAATDSKYFTAVSENIYRFSPQVATGAELSQIHGIDERIGSEEFKNGIRFYYHLLKNSSQ